MKNILSAALASLVLFAAVPAHASYQEPKYTVDRSWGKIEVRKYAPMVVAELTVEGDKKKALTAGFKELAAYIFGKNSPYVKPGSAPVAQQASTEAEKPKGEKIPMTAPVIRQGVKDTGPWKIQFYMAPPYNLENLPVPANENIRLHQLDARKFVVLTFSGTGSVESFAKRTKELREYMKIHNLVGVGEPVEAYYDPPWTLPFLRRNEVMIEVR